ncbi:MAG TPA: maleylpyruvate isomerase family mycothiol-dependent enzyme [Acidimicrobiales bacterium]|nr:maleylpyruvate isomerase family mycothiol-dependent enzyme [Acidimicrobiales bacterium]
MPPAVSPSIDNLDTTWESLIALCGALTDDDWKRPTGCPGWSVQDQVSHLIDYESRALGRPQPETTAVSRPHTKNALGESNEVGVEHRRSRTGAEVLDELRDVTAARSAQLHALTADDLSREVATPAGPGTIADMLTLRVMDTWSHEQDIRRAVGRPGHGDGPAVLEAIDYWSRFLPFVVGKRAEAPDGVTAVVEVGPRTYSIEVAGGRARPLDSAPAQPTVHLSMPATTFAALVGGRSDAPDDVVITGDVALGRRIRDALGFLP